MSQIVLAGHSGGEQMVHRHAIVGHGNEVVERCPR
jgi:hypothetical protein